MQIDVSKLSWGWCIIWIQHTPIFEENKRNSILEREIVVEPWGDEATKLKETPMK